MPFAYILRSKKDGGYYFGSTDNLSRRIAAHNGGKVRSTKSRRPLMLHYSEEYATVSEARRREMFFKSIDGYNWLNEQGITLRGKADSSHGELAERLLSRRDGSATPVLSRSERASEERDGFAKNRRRKTCHLHTF